MNKKTMVIALVIVTSFFITTAYQVNTITAFQEPIAHLTFKTVGGGTWGDLGLYIAQYLRDIGIEVEIKIEEWSVFVGSLILTHDYDIGIVGLSGGGASPDMRDVYTSTGSLNCFGLTQDMPYENESETMQNEGVTISDLDERQQHYYDWQQLVMDKIIPILPLYAPKSHVASWSTLEGYDARWGYTDCLPYMNFNGYHEGQDSIDEINLADANWRELNPLLSDDTSSTNIWGLMAEPILQFSPDLAPLKTGLVYDWDQIDEFHYKFYMRDNVYWNPSYNTTGRDASSDPLDTISTSELMVGLKNDEYSDGTNQQVTAKDAVFTYLAWANPTVSESTTYHDWISDVYVDETDPLAFHVLIDGDPSTPEREQYVDFWTRLSWTILPEFFLNSTDPTITYSSGGVKTWGFYPGILDTPQWRTFSTSAFGCGKYMLDYYIKNSVTVLRRSPYWFGVGAIDGTTGMQPFVETFNMRVIPDNSAALAEFKAGKLDIISVTSFPSERKQMQADPRFNIQSFLTASFNFMFFNLQRPFIGGTSNYKYLDEPGKQTYTKGVAVRKAINYAIDRDEMNQVLYDGEYFLAHSILYPFTSFYYYNDIIKYDRNLDAAIEWLTAAGYTIEANVSIPLLGIVAAIGAAAFIAFKYKKKR
ncbi:MAG: ABC transporter substrate-binding protein [Candidatus Heimdallarchaeaceae archaeon]